jgi:hypothetical protein
MCYGEGPLFLVVNVTCVDYVAFAFMRHFSNQRSIRERCDGNFCEAVNGYWSEAIIAVSTVNVSIFARFQVITVVSMKLRFVFWDVLLCKIIVDQRFRP